MGFARDLAQRALRAGGNELERSISIDVRGDDLALYLVHLYREAITQPAVRRRENVEEAHGRSHSHLECAVAVEIRHAHRCVDVCERAMGSKRWGRAALLGASRSMSEG
jgi:hypothetical protein